MDGSELGKSMEKVSNSVQYRSVSYLLAFPTNVLCTPVDLFLTCPWFYFYDFFNIGTDN